VLGAQLAGADGEPEGGLVCHAVVAERVEDGLLVDAVFAPVVGL
jgi:hypothetical protein